MYEKEGEQFAQKIEKLKAEGADEYVLKKQVCICSCILYKEISGSSNDSGNMNILLTLVLQDNYFLTCI